jgi:hypothetical protein
MATIHGRNAIIKIDNYSGSLVDLSAYADSVDFGQMADANEDTNFSSDLQPAKGYLEGLKDASFSFSGPWDAVVDRHLGLIKGRTGTYEVGPEGGATGKRRFTGEAILTGYDVSGPTADKLTFTATFQPTGGVTANTF